MKEGWSQFALRLPDGMRERIKAEAKANGRSMNDEILWRLEVSFEIRRLQQQIAANALAGRDYRAEAMAAVNARWAQHQGPDHPSQGFRP